LQFIEIPSLSLRDGWHGILTAMVRPKPQYRD